NVVRQLVPRVPRLEDETPGVADAAVTRVGGAADVEYLGLDALERRRRIDGSPGSASSAARAQCHRAQREDARVYRGASSRTTRSTQAVHEASSQEANDYQCIRSEATILTDRAPILRPISHASCNMTSRRLQAGLAAADFDRDGKPDLVVSVNMDDQAIFVLKGV